MTKVIAIIPARFQSTRFPGKPLVADTGKSLIQHVYEQTQKSHAISKTIVATDDQRIFDNVNAFGGEAIMTRSDHPNGTSRLAEVAESLTAYDIIVNVQGDEPEIDSDHIDLAIAALIDEQLNNIDEITPASMSTLASPFQPDDNPDNPNIVKVVLDQNNRAIYFSRSPIPFNRNANSNITLLKHIGLYVYKRSFLLDYVNWSPTPLEQAEQLEQLRVLEHGKSIAVAIADVHSQGIDTPEQYEAFATRYIAKR